MTGMSLQIVANICALSEDNRIGGGYLLVNRHT